MHSLCDTDTICRCFLCVTLICTPSCTANPTWGDIFESWQLKARTSLLPRFSKKTLSSVELWALEQHSKMSPQVGSAVYIYVGIYSWYDCLCVLLHMIMYTRVYTHIHTHTLSLSHTHAHTQEPRWLWRVHIYMCGHIQLIWSLMCPSSYEHTRTRVHTHIHTLAHTHIHTHTRTRADMAFTCLYIYIYGLMKIIYYRR